MRPGLGVLCAIALAATAVGAQAPALDLDITNTSIEELYNLDITTLSRTEQRYRTTAAALFVVTHDDLARSGVTSIPEALRLVPGVQVAKVDASKWAVSIRGFSGRTSNKLLVMIDGRSIYNPLFAGVLWEIRDVSIEDVERIEVIRGPGGTLWGANAVNGVINIITRSAAETQGTLVRVGAGDEERALIVARHGRRVGSGHLRVYGKFFDRDAGFDPAGTAADDWTVGRIGFRADWERGANVYTLSGDGYDGEVGETNGPGLEQDVEHAGGNLLFRWSRTRKRSAQQTLQVYYDATDLDNLLLGERRDTVDVEFQQDERFRRGPGLVWGLGYRATRDDITSSAFLTLTPRKRQDALYSAFVQAAFPWREGRLNLSAGTKVERNDYTGTELQPGVRLSWAPRSGFTLWGAVSRAVRTPSRLEIDLTAPIQGPLKPRAETLLAYEAGARWQPHKRLALDAALFWNDYDRLVTLEGPALGYEMFGRTSGIEMNLEWQPRTWWRVDMAASVLDVDFALRSGSAGGTDPAFVERTDPGFQFSLHQFFQVDTRVTIDAAFRHVDALPALDVPSYGVLDLNLTWLVRPKLRLALRGRNLLTGHHAEQRGTGTTEVEPDVFFNAVVDF